MKTVIQRVSRASVRVEARVVGEIGQGLLILLGVEAGDDERDADALAEKIASLRVFPGRTPMDRGLADVGGGCLIISQFTLSGSVRKGRRPSFSGAEQPARAEVLYEYFMAALRDAGVPVASGSFGASMQVELVNEGPVTLIVESRQGSIV